MFLEIADTFSEYSKITNESYIFSYITNIFLKYIILQCTATSSKIANETIGDKFRMRWNFSRNTVNSR